MSDVKDRTDIFTDRELTLGEMIDWSLMTGNELVLKLQAFARLLKNRIPGRTEEQILNLPWSESLILMKSLGASLERTAKKHEVDINLLNTTWKDPKGEGH